MPLARNHRKRRLNRAGSNNEETSEQHDEPLEAIPDVVRNNKNKDEESDEMGVDNLASSRFLAIHVYPERPANIQIGAALLDCRTGELCTLGRTIGWEGDFGFLVSLLLDLTKPVSNVIVSSKMSESLLECLRSISLPPDAVPPVRSEEESEEATLRLKTTIIPNAFFDFPAACKAISAKCGGEHALGSVVDLLNRASVQAAGAALAHAQRLFPDMPPITFDMFDLGSFLIMDGGSSKSLDITRLEEHPSIIRGRGVPKEGFSLLSLLDRSKSLIGKRTLRRWVSRPLTNIAEITERHEAVGYLINRMGHDEVAQASKHLGRIGDLPRSLLRLKTCTARPADWLIIFDSLTSIQLAINELDAVKSNLDGAKFPNVLELILRANHSPGLFEVGRALDSLDWETLRGEIKEPSARLVPRAGLSNEVDEARTRLHNLPDFLEAETRACGTPGTTIRCIPVIGFVAAVEEGGGFPESPASELLFEARKQTETGQDGPLVRYYKTDRTRFLDSQLGDVPGLVRDVEDAFLRKIEAIVLTYEADLLLAVHRAAELDVFLCFAEVAHDFGYCRPEMCPEAVTMVSGARHPLLERILEDRFIPNDIFLDRTCLVITGPNYSGKSVVLKTTALLHVLAQIGAFVPAARARLGVVDRIFTRMSSMETAGAAAVQRESSFSIDVQQTVSMLRCCTPNSLILLDEFGKGTNSLDGSSLLAAVIRHLAHGKCGPTPRTMIATHLVEMFDAGLIAPEEAKVGEMAVVFEGNEPVPLFSLHIGKRTLGESYGIACARKAGVCISVLERATELTTRLTNGIPLWQPDERKTRERKAGMESTVTEFMSHAPDKPWTKEAVETLLALVERIGK